MIVAVTLSRGAVRMARQQVIVKHLPAMQNFGSMDVLCCDKTGTLTSGFMTFDKALDTGGAASRQALRYAYLNSTHQTGIRSPLDAALLKQEPPDTAGYRKVDEIPFDSSAAGFRSLLNGATNKC